MHMEIEEVAEVEIVTALAAAWTVKAPVNVPPVKGRSRVECPVTVPVTPPVTAPVSGPTKEAAVIVHSGLICEPCTCTIPEPIT